MYKKIIYTLLLSSVIVSCTSKQKNGENLPLLTVGVMSSMEYLPIAVASKNGYFKKNGVQVEVQKFYSANERDAAIQSGNLDGSILDYTGAAIQNANGVEIYLTSQCDGTFEFIAGKNSAVKSVKELKNKKVAVSRNTVIDFCTDLALETAGMTQKDIQKEEINKIPLRLEMLRNNKIDASFLPDPFISIAKTDGNISIFSIKDLNLHITGLVFTKKAITEKSEAINRFYSAYNEAVKEINAKKPTDFSELLINDLGFHAGAVLPLVVFPNYTDAVLPVENDLNKVGQWLKSKKLISEDYEMKSLINSSFIGK